MTNTGEAATAIKDAPKSLGGASGRAEPQTPSLKDVHTGRHHQIRAQLQAIGCPIKGDLKYGFDRSNPDGGIHLHARKLVLTHPVTKEIITFIADLPNNSIWQSI